MANMTRAWVGDRGDGIGLHGLARVRVPSSAVAIIRFLDGKQRGETATLDDAALNGEGRYRFKRRELTRKGGRTYYLKAVSTLGR